MESKTFFLPGAKPKVAYITGGKTLLTLYYIMLLVFSFLILLILHISLI